MILARRVLRTSHWMDYGCFTPNLATMTGMSDAEQEDYLELIQNVMPDGRDALPWFRESRLGISATTGTPNWNSTATRYWSNMYFRPAQSNLMKNRHGMLAPILYVRPDAATPIMCNPNPGPNYFGRNSAGVKVVADVDDTWRRDIRLNLDRLMGLDVGTSGGEPYVSQAKYTNFRHLMVLGPNEIDYWPLTRQNYVADGEMEAVIVGPPIFDDYNIDARVSGNIAKRDLQEGDPGYMSGWNGVGASITYQDDNTVSEGDGARITFGTFSGSYAIQAGGAAAIIGTPATLTFSVYMRAIGAAPLTDVLLQIDWNNGTSYLSTSNQSFTVSNASMTQYSFTATRPAAATHINIIIMRLAIGGVLDIDFLVVRSSGTLPTPSATSHAITSGWTKVLDDDFNTLDASIWSKAVAFGWVDRYGDIAAWDDSLVTLANSRVRMTAQYVNNQWRSGLILSKNKRTYTYGYFEANIKLTPAQGAFPAWWLFPNNPLYGGWPACGEIDIMEAIGANELTSAFGTMIYSRVGVGLEKQVAIARGPDFTQDFHTYGLLWEKSIDNRVILRWFIDNIPFGMYDQSQWPAASGGPAGSPFDYPYHMIINLAMGGDWAGTAPPSASGAFIEVDWVRVWQRT